MISKTKCKDDLYTINVRYLVIDIYDWDKNEEKRYITCMLVDQHAHIMQQVNMKHHFLEKKDKGLQIHTLVMI